LREEGGGRRIERGVKNERIGEWVSGWLGVKAEAVADCDLV
jgi:hypothetical protein